MANFLLRCYCNGHALRDLGSQCILPRGSASLQQPHDFVWSEAAVLRDRTTQEFDRFDGHALTCISCAKSCQMFSGISPFCFEFSCIESAGVHRYVCSIVTRLVRQQIAEQKRGLPKSSQSA
jgi:hypothetical protein